jgi:hypothetical protein
MEENLKQLLLKDLCARLPYNVKIQITILDKGKNIIDDFDYMWLGILYSENPHHEIKPYLRPMSSMTKEEFDEYEIANEMDTAESSKAIRKNLNREKHISSWYHGVDWLNAHHFDYRGLIPKGLALEAKEGMYNQN